MVRKTIVTGFTCRIGRTAKDMRHPTCKTCQKAGIKCGFSAREKKAARLYQAWAEDREDKKVLVTTYDLQSLNKHVNKANGDRIYRGIKRTWQRLIGYRKDGKGSNLALLLFGPHKDRKRTLEIVRYIPSQRQAFDEDNLWGSCKALVDSLVLAGVIKDDNGKWLERIPPVEKVDKERPRVEISVL